MENKSILVIDTPEDCLACPCFSVIGSEHCSVTMKEVGLHIPMWCPLRYLPQKKNTSKIQGFGYSQIMWANKTIHQNEGWNACLDEIVGETE